MNNRTLDLTNADNPCMRPAFMGHTIGRDGVLRWRVCSWCESASAVNAEAARLKIPVTHGMCAPHFAEQMAGRGT